MRSSVADAIKLDANENPYAPLVGGALAGRRQPLSRAAAAALRRRNGRALRRRAATTRRSPAAPTMRSTCWSAPSAARRVDAVAICPPTFSAYAQFARLQGARLIERPLDAVTSISTPTPFLAGGAPETEAEARLPLLAQQSDRQRGRCRSRASRWPKRCPNTIVVLDEAYLEFSRAPSLAGEAARCTISSCCETLSKAYRPGRRAGRLRDRRSGTDRDRRPRASALPAAQPVGRSRADALCAVAPRRSIRSGSRRIKAERDRLAPLLATSPVVKSGPQRRRQFPVPRSRGAGGAGARSSAARHPRPLPAQCRARRGSPHDRHRGGE